MPDDYRIERPCDCRDSNRAHSPKPDCPRCGGSGWLPTGPPPPGVSVLLERIDRLERERLRLANALVGAHQFAERDCGWVPPGDSITYAMSVLDRDDRVYHAGIAAALAEHDRLAPPAGRE